MPSQQQRKDAARRRLDRQLASRRHRDAHNRRLSLIVSVVATLLIATLVVVFVVVTTGESSTNPPAAAPGSPSTSSPPFTPTVTAGPCKYTSVDPATDKNLRDVGLPPDPATTPHADRTVRFTTNRGVIEATLDGRTAPCNVQALVYLIGKHFYDNSPCPRIVNAGIQIVQCGSGTNGTDGGPTFTMPDEDLSAADYSRGTIAMANTGQPNTASSQFFFITNDSNNGLAKSYTVVGHVTQGLAILDKVVRGGDDESSSAGGGKPNVSLVFKAVRVLK